MRLVKDGWSVGQEVNRMRIVDVITSCGKTGFYFDDQRAIKKGAVADGNYYHGTPVTPGFTSIRQAGESLSVMLILEDGQIGYGDCCAVQYSGAGGRDPLFLAKEFEDEVERVIKPRLLNRELKSFRSLAQEIDQLTENSKKIHTALRYGVSQAILDACAKAQHIQMCDVIAQEYGTMVSKEMIPIFSQSGDNRYDNVDKMVIKAAQVLPHALINHVETKLGLKGEKLLAYVHWLRNRIVEVRSDQEYHPIIHLDVYGTFGSIFNQDYHAMVQYMRQLAKAAAPFKLRIEGPVDFDDREATMLGLQAITKALDEEQIPVEIVADEWCNTIEDIMYFADHQAGHMIQIKTPDLGSIHNVVEAVLYCQSHGVAAYQGGTCNETDLSAKACIHVAMATSPAQILAKPGMGVDEGFMLAYNEMQRILALKKAGH
jgi:methylaspartate ammonia-lyase